VGRGAGHRRERVVLSPGGRRSPSLEENLHGELKGKLGFAFSTKEVTLNTFD